MAAAFEFPNGCAGCAKKLRASLGCEKDAPVPYELEMDGEVIQLRRCPMRLLTATTHRALEFYGHYKQGHLPVAGGLLDQSATFLRAMSIIGGEIDRQDGIRRDAKDYASDQRPR